MSDPRRRARELAAGAAAGGDPTAWFEALYAEAHSGTAVVPWADLVPNPHLVRWLDAHRETVTGTRALDVGCGLGDNAEELVRRGFDVTAFDVSVTAVAEARARFPSSRVTYVAADLLAPPPEWRSAFDLVEETYTLQVLPPGPRAQAAARLRELLAPGGTLVVVARGREPSDPEGAMPWPLTRAELDAIAADDLTLEHVDDFADDESPPVRRFVATYRRAR